MTAKTTTPFSPYRFMNLNVALRTLSVLAAWLILQNFNLPNHFKPVVGSTTTIPGLFLGTGKGSETLPFLNPSKGYQIKTVVLDAGHGGKDPGCIGTSGNYEKHNALAIVLQLGALIQANYPDVKVIYTRDSDVFIELKERANIANRNKADLFISVHCNSLSVASAKGTETYVLGLHKAKHNLEVAKRENASIYLEENYQRDYAGYDPNSAEAHIIGSMWQSAYLEQSILLAGLVQEHVQTLAGRENRGVKQAGFLVLKETAMPSVLIESGYLTNATEDAFLLSEEGRDQMALAIFQAFDAYKSKMEGSAAAPVITKTPKKVTKNNPPPPAPAVVKVNNSTPSKINQQNTKTLPPAAPVCRIWLMSWPKRLDPNTGQLALLSNIKEEKINDQYHYYATNFASCTDAERMLPEVRNLGFKNARIE
jgi:N-acetylmuramoyl-L-alanine amidase